MNIVRENLFEFQRGQNPSVVLALGRLAEVEKWLKQFILRNAYTINSNWEIDLKKDFIITSSMNFPEEIPEFIQFNICPGSFLIRDKKLASLRGCPRIVNKDFFVDYNKLMSLGGCPIQVDGDFYIQHNLRPFTPEEIKKICKIGGKLKV
jgi:hypothetical protein